MVNEDRFNTDEYEVLIGNREWILQNDMMISPVVDQLMTMQEELGQTAILLAVNGCLTGMVAVADTIKDEAPMAVQTLLKRGVRVVLLTGDNRKTANAIAEEVFQNQFVRSFVRLFRLFVRNKLFSESLH